MFQQAVLRQQGQGVVGSIMINGPMKATPGILLSTITTFNKVGGFVRLIDGTDATYSGDPADYGNDAPWGIIADSKQYAAFGNVGDPLGASLILNNGVVADLVTLTSGIMVQLSNTPLIGAQIFVDTTTGVLESAATLVAAAPPAGTILLAGASVVYANTGVAQNQAVISLGGVIPAVTPMA